MEAVAPGKLIISGEHAVVHGSPAIAMAINRYAKASIKQHHTPSSVLFDFLNLRYQKSMTINALRKLKHRLFNDYQSFLEGKHPIRDVLKLPFELSQFALTNLLDKFNHGLSDGIQLCTHSDIPIGCGMGSSAAMILCVQHAIAHHLKMDLANEHHFNYGLEAENLQHGKSSGLDLQVSLKGGCIQYHNNHITALAMPDLPMYVVNTGQRQSSSGECIHHSKQFFTSEKNLSADFTAVTTQVIHSLEKNSLADLQQALRENHRLLTTIGVVPEKVQHFIRDLEHIGAAAKICGAGAIAGQEAGIVLIIADFSPDRVCDKYNYTCEFIKGESRGLHLD